MAKIDQMTKEEIINQILVILRSHNYTYEEGVSESIREILKFFRDSLAIN